MKVFLNSARTPDMQPPIFRYATVDSFGNLLTMYFNETIQNVSGFTLNTTVSSGIISSGNVGGSSITFAISPVAVYEDTITIDYSPGNVIDRLGNALESFSSTNVVNNIPFTGYGAPSFLTDPIITGSLLQGEQLTATYAFTITGYSDTETFGWMAADDTGGTNLTSISGISNTIYIPSSGYVGKYIKVSVTGSNIYGVTSKDSPYVGPITTNITPPVFTSEAMINGGSISGDTATVSYSVDSSDGETFSWLRALSSLGSGSAAISPAQTGSSYNITAGDLAVGEYFTCVVTASNASGSTVSSGSWQGPVSVIIPASRPSSYDSFLSHATTKAETYATKWIDGTFVGSISNNDLINMCYYDPHYSFRRMGDFVGGTLADILESGAVSQETWYKDNYLIGPPSSNNGAVPAWKSESLGLTEDWIRNTGTDSRDAVVTLSNNATYAADFALTSFPVSMNGSREAANNVLTQLNAEIFCGASHRTKTEELIEYMLGAIGQYVENSWATSAGGSSVYHQTLTNGGHTEQWLGTYTTNDADGTYISGSHNLDSGGDPGGQGQAAFMITKNIFVLGIYHEYSNKTGSHTGGTSTDLMVDSNATFSAGSKHNLIGRIITNNTTSATGTITDNTPTSVTATMSGGSGTNDWSNSDTYTIAGLINNGAQDEDSRVIPQAKRLADLVWNEMWVASDESLGYRFNTMNGNGAPDLANLNFPAYAWLFKMTGYSRYKIMAESIFNGSLRSGFLTANYPTQTKQFNELMGWTWDGLDWYNDGVTLHGTGI